jgi:hypothetical protein
LKDDRFPLPQELVAEMPAIRSEAVCNYLSKGKQFETYRGYSWCRFHCGIHYEKMGSREYTDGKWVWPEGLVHYVQLHSIVLPEEFVSSAISGGGNVEISGDATASLDFWMEWAALRRSPKIRQRLAERLAAVETEVGKLIESEINLTTEREGVSDQRCIFNRCAQPALLRRKVCARHFLNDQEIERITSELYQLPADLCSLK